MMNEDVISQVPIFASLSPSDLKYLGEALIPCQEPKDTLLLQEGELGDSYYILLDGEVEIIKALGTADERLLAVRGAISFLGEMSMFSEDGVHTASVRARTPLRLLKLTHEDLDALLHRQPTLAYEMMRTLSRRLEESENLTIRDLRRKNRELIKAYQELEAAQAQIIEKEKLERELEVARQIQMSILPSRLPEIPCFDFGAQVIPMSAVGGDFFDFISLGNNTLGIAVGDVADHGVPAALFMALSVTLLRVEADRSTSPGEVLRSVNRHLLEMDITSMFVTLLYGILDCSTHEFRYARAGHEPPLLLNASGEMIERDHGVGQPLGLFPDPIFDQQSISLPPESLLLIYSDGVTDATNVEGKFLGLEGLQGLLHQGIHASAQEICAEVLVSLAEYRGATIQHDDVTLLTLKVQK